MQLEGSWLDGSRSEQGAIWAWGEWEPESVVIRSLNRVAKQHPRFLWKPFWVRKQSYVGFHNTDPFIFDGFYYTDCRQQAGEGLRQLDSGSIIVFGSVKNSDWVLDTVLVVREYIDHDYETYVDRLTGRVPDCFWDVTLAPTYQGRHARLPRRLYIGATHSNQFEQMFSFFPCTPTGGDVGFARPPIKLSSDHFTAGLSRNARGYGSNSRSLATSELQRLWTSLTDQVLEQGLCLGIAAVSPNLREPDDWKV